MDRCTDSQTRGQRQGHAQVHTGTRTGAHRDTHRCTQGHAQVHTGTKARDFNALMMIFRVELTLKMLCTGRDQIVLLTRVSRITSLYKCHLIEFSVGSISSTWSLDSTWNTMIIRGIPQRFAHVLEYCTLLKRDVTKQNDLLATPHTRHLTHDTSHTMRGRRMIDRALRSSSNQGR